MFSRSEAREWLGLGTNLNEFLCWVSFFSPTCGLNGKDMIQREFSEMLNMASQFMRVLDEKMNGLIIGDRVGSKVSGALLHLSLEHFGAIVVLLSNNLNGSAAALLRLQYEALIRGLYFQQCASESDAMDFLDGNKPPQIYEMISKLEEKPGFTAGVFSRVHKREWGELNSYTHGGSAQVQRRFSGADLVGNYSEKDRRDILKATKGMALLAASHAAIACGSLDLAKELKEEFAGL